MFNIFKNKNKYQLLAVVDGTSFALEEVSDPVFAQKMMGDGVAFHPSGNIVVAPSDGIITLIPETKHAFGMVLDNKMEILVHIGIDTVSLKGEGFKQLVDINTPVKAGTPIIEFDKAFIESQGISLETPMIILNHENYDLSKIKVNGTVIKGESVVLEYQNK